MIHHQVTRNSKFLSSRTTSSREEVFAATTCPKCQHSSFFNTHIDIQLYTHTLTYSSCKNLFRMRDKGQCHCVFFLHMKWIVLMLIVFGHHEDCVFDVNTHIAGFFLLVFFLDMSSQAILSKFHFAMITIHLFTHFKCSILLCSLKWAQI